MVTKILTLSFLCFGQVILLKHDLPAHFPRCSRDDPKINECLLKASEIVRPDLVKGIPDLGFDPIEPFVIPEITLQQGTKSLNFKAVLKNVYINGLSNYKFSKIEFDSSKLEWLALGKIHNLTMEGNYTIDGKVLIAPIQGKGKFISSLENVNITATQKLEIVKKKGVDFVRPTSSHVAIDLTNPKVKFMGLFDGNKELSKATTAVINENVQELFEDLKPVVEEVVTSIMEKLLFKSIQANVPYDKLYPLKSK